MKVLFVVPYAPTRIRTRPFHLVKALAANGHEVTLATLQADDADRESLAELSSTLHDVCSEPISLARSLWNCVKTLPTSEPLQAHFSWHPKLAGEVIALAREGEFDAVHVEHLRGVRYGLAIVRALAMHGVRRPPVVWDSVDCISDLFRHAAGRGRTAQVRWAARLELPRTERYESLMVQAFPRVLATSEADRQGLLRLASRTSDRHVIEQLEHRIVVVPNGVDLEHFAPSSEPRDPATLVMSGKMSYHANVAAAVKFADDVFPLIRAARPDARLLIVGKDPSPEVLKLAERPGIEVTGTVPDVRPFLQRATVAVAPIQYGVGIQNKVLEAMACGTATVATPTAVEALGATVGREVAVAATPDQLAAVVLELIQRRDMREAMGRAARAYVERHHAWRAIAAQLAHIYEDAAA